MKAPVLFLFAFLFSLEAAAQTTSCFDHFFNEGEAALNRRRPNFELARKKFAAAKECDEATYEQKRTMERRIREVEERNLDALENEIDRAESARDEANRQSIQADSLRKIAVFALETSEIDRKKADSLRVEAQKSARRALANDLAFKAQTALRDGDRTTAFRLAEMSWQFVDPGNQRTEQALVEIFFQNEKTKNARPLSWKTAAFPIFSATEIPVFLKISADGKAVATATAGEGSVTMWEIGSGRELFSAFETGNVSALAIADEGRFLVFATEKGISIFKKNGPPESRVLFEIVDGKNSVSELQITADQSRIIARFDDHSVLIFDLETGAERGRLGFEKGDFLRWSQVSQDGKKLFLASENGLFQSFDLEKGEILSKIEPNEKGSNAPLLAFAQNADGSRAALSRPDRTLQIFDLKTGQLALEFRPETLAAYRLFFSSDGRFLTAIFINHDLKKWDATTGELVEKRELEEGDEAFTPNGALTFSPDGRWVLQQSSFETIEVFEVKSFAPEQKPLRVFRFDQSIQQLVFSPDGRSVLVGLQSGLAQLFDLETGANVLAFGSGNGINLIEFAQKSPVLAFSREGGVIEIWATETRSSCFPTLEKSENAQPKVVDFSISPDGQTLVMDFVGDSMQMRSAADGRLLFSKKAEGGSVAFSPDSRVAAAYYYGSHTIWFFEMPSGRLLKKADLPSGGIYSAHFSPDGRWFQAFDLTDSTTTTLFDAQTFEQKKLPKGASFVVFSDKTSKAALISENWSAIEPFDLEKMQPIGERLFFDPRSITSPRFSPSGDQFFLIENGRTLRVFDFPSFKKRWETTFQGIRDLRWSLDGSRILTADYYLIAWDAATGKQLFDLPYNSYQNDISADGRLLLATSGQREVLVFDAVSGQKLVTLRGRGIIRAVHFSPDSRRIVTACQEGFAEIWDAQTGRQLFVLQGDTTSMERVVFFEKGSKLAILQGGEVKIWVLATDEILQKTNAASSIAPLSADQIFDFLAGEAVFENADWGKIRDGISAVQALELARHFARQGELSRDAATYDKKFDLAVQFFRSALNDLGNASVLLELAAAEARWMQRALASGRRDETLKRAKQVEKLLASATVLPSSSKLDLAQALTAMGKKREAEALFSTVLAHDTAQLKDALYQIEQTSRNLSNLDATEYGSYNFEKDASSIIGEAVSIEIDAPFLTSFDLFAAGDIEKAIKTSREELAAALQNNLDYAYAESAAQAASAFGNLSFYLLFEKRFAESRQMAEFGLAVDSSQHFIQTNLAHSHLFLSETKRAMAIYQALKNTPDPSVEGQTFGQTMIADLEKLADKGIRPKDLEKILQLLGKKK